MQEIPRAILLPPPSQPPQRSNARAVQGDSDSVIDTGRGTRRQPAGAGQAFLTLVDTRREDTVEIRGKQFRFRPYTSRGAADGATREAELAVAANGAANDSGAIAEPADDDISVNVLDGFGAGPHGRNSSTFIASFIAQERLQQGLHNPPFAAASDAYRRAGGSPSAIDNQPRVVRLAV